MENLGEINEKIEENGFIENSSSVESNSENLANLINEKQKKKRIRKNENSFLKPNVGAEYAEHFTVCYGKKGDNNIADFDALHFTLSYFGYNKFIDEVAYNYDYKFFFVDETNEKIIFEIKFISLPEFKHFEMKLFELFENEKINEKNNENLERIFSSINLLTTTNNHHYLIGNKNLHEYEINDTFKKKFKKFLINNNYKIFKINAII